MCGALGTLRETNPDNKQNKVWQETDKPHTLYMVSDEAQSLPRRGPSRSAVAVHWAGNEVSNTLQQSESAKSVKTVLTCHTS